MANKLNGRALETYDNMSAEDLENYEDFKADILRAYKLRPEAYRLRFRGGKRSGDSYLECARHLEQAFKRWIMSEGVDTLRDLEELMVMEQFINAADKELVLWVSALSPSSSLRCQTVCWGSPLREGRLPTLWGSWGLPPLRNVPETGNRLFPSLVTV